MYQLLFLLSFCLCTACTPLHRAVHILEETVKFIHVKQQQEMADIKVLTPEDTSDLKCSRKNYFSFKEGIKNLTSVLPTDHVFKQIMINLENKDLESCVTRPKSAKSVSCKTALMPVEDFLSELDDFLCQHRRMHCQHSQ